MRGRYTRLASTVAIAVAGCAAIWTTVSGCSTPDSQAKIDAIGPSRDQFTFVAPVMVRRCGSIDCHGGHFRNMRIYGYGGQRRDGGITPELPKFVTTDEANASYDSIVGLEPEIMSLVVQSGGAGPERLTFVRKGRGDEDHKGDQRIKPHDDSDNCITSWLANRVDQEACKRAGCITGIDDAGVLNIGSCP
jgi:hypothetical protein